jgi:TolB-like protein/Tfp pilus assembly protein PilF
MLSCVALTGIGLGGVVKQLVLNSPARILGLASMENVQSSGGIVRFGPFELDHAAGELRKNGTRIRLQDQPLQLLQILLQQPGKVISREELQRHIWPSDTFVDFDHGINNAIKRLREALGDTAETPRYIKTVPRRGYRFAGTIERDGPGIQSLAVLPLENLSGDPEQDYFADGMTEALITTLAKIRALRVISRTTVMHYKGVHRPLRDIARELSVQIVVEGTVLRFGERVRISVQLIETSTDCHLWAESYERDLRDILKLQSDISRAVAREISAKLTPLEREHLARARSVSPEAYELYLRGRHYWDQRSAQGLTKGAEHFSKAISLDRNYAAAYAGLADCAGSGGFWGFTFPDEGCGKAKAAALKSLEIEETAEAHTSLGWALMHYDFDFLKAEQHFQRAIELNPGYVTAHQWYAHCLGYTYRLDHSLERVRLALDIDPLSINVNTTYVGVLWFQRRFDYAIDQCRRILELSPNFATLRWLLANLFQAEGMHAEALAERQWATEASGRAPLFLAELADSHAAAGNRAEALHILDELQTISKTKYVMAYWIALIYAGLNQRDDSFHWLDIAYQERSPILAFLRIDPRLEPLHSDARFDDHLSRLKLPKLESGRAGSSMP